MALLFLSSSLRARAFTPLLQPAFSRALSSSTLYSSSSTFRSGEKILVEIDHFGPLGATANILSDVSDDASIIGNGLILQSEIHKFRQSRDNVDVVAGELLDGFVQRVRREDGKVDISLFPVGVDKIVSVKEAIFDILEDRGRLDIGEKSSPEEIEHILGPGVSKSNFKKALGMLYKEQVIQRPGKHDVELL